MEKKTDSERDKSYWSREPDSLSTCFKNETTEDSRSRGQKNWPVTPTSASVLKARKTTFGEHLGNV